MCYTLRPGRDGIGARPNELSGSATPISRKQTATIMTAQYRMCMMMTRAIIDADSTAIYTCICICMHSAMARALQTHVMMHMQPRTYTLYNHENVHHAYTRAVTAIYTAQCCLTLCSLHQHRCLPAHVYAHDDAWWSSSAC